MADVFDENNEQEIDLSLEDLVGEGKKYSEPNQLVKAYVHSEAFIEQLKKENADFRAKLDAEQANKNNQKPPEPNGQEPVPDPDKGNEPPKNSSTPNSDDFRSQIRDTVKALNEENKGLTNLDTAAARLVEVLGSEAKATEAIRNRARELDVTVDWMKETAMRSPSAFYTAMGLSAQGGSRTTPAPSSDVRLINNSNTRDFEYFDKIRKDDPKLYWSRETQLEMQRQAKSNPDFYKR